MGKVFYLIISLDLVTIIRKTNIEMSMIKKTFLFLIPYIMGKKHG